MSDSVKKYEEMLEDGYVPNKRNPFPPKSLEEYLNESSSTESKQ